MTKHLLWAALCAWLVLMGIVWDLLVPKGLSVGTFTMLTASGPLFLLAATKRWSVQRPAKSTR